MAKSHSHAFRFRQVLRLFELLGHPIRVVILQRLARLPGTAGDLERGLPISRAAIVQHLKLMESAGLVASSPNGRKRIYRVQPRGLAPLHRWLTLIDSHSWPSG
jgi:predicted transcriptional regulator